LFKPITSSSCFKHVVLTPTSNTLSWLLLQVPVSSALFWISLHALPSSNNGVSTKWDEVGRRGEVGGREVSRREKFWGRWKNQKLWAGEDVFLVHPQNGLNGLILNWCIGGCWFTPAITYPQDNNLLLHIENSGYVEGIKDVCTVCSRLQRADSFVDLLALIARLLAVNGRNSQ
jgi:hypothetical protein